MSRSVRSLFGFAGICVVLITGVLLGDVLRYVEPEAEARPAVLVDMRDSAIVEITAYNPYRAEIEAEVKCDWNSQVRSFGYRKTFVIPGKGSAKMAVPSSFRKCEVWPKITKWL